MTLAPDLALVTEAGVPADENTDDDAEDYADVGASWMGDLPEWRLLVAPLGGTFRSAPQVAVDRRHQHRGWPRRGAQ